MLLSSLWFDIIFLSMLGKRIQVDRDDAICLSNRGAAHQKVSYVSVLDLIFYGHLFAAIVRSI